MDFLKDSHLVEKSKRLVWARFNSYTAGELRLLEVYLSRINPRDPSSSEVRFTLSEYCQLLDLPSVDIRNVSPQLAHFLGNVVIFQSPDCRSGQGYTLFTKATWYFDKDLGQDVITIKCNPDLTEVFFNIAQDGYVRYRLRYTLAMRSRYSIRLYCMLRDWVKTGKWSVDLPCLRQELGATEVSYLVYKDFRKWVLDHAVNEINRLSDLQVAYQTISKGRKVTGIAFTVKLKPSQKTLAVRAEAADAAFPEHDGAWYAQAADKDLSPSAAEQLSSAIRTAVHKDFPGIPLDQLDMAAWETIAGAYRSIVRKRDPMAEPIKDAGKVLWSVLITHKGYADYIPARYTNPELFV